MSKSPINIDAIDLSDEKLKRLAGSGAFFRGYDYYKQDPQLDYEVSGTKVLANISGTQSYRQQLTFARQGLDGHCSCPASENIDFCKHCVALALAVREREASPEIKKVRLSARQQEQQDLKQYLAEIDREVLEASLLELINDDKARLTSWSMRAHASLNPLDSKYLKKKITQAFPINKHLHRHNQVSKYFTTAESVIELLAQHSEKLDAKELEDLTDYALARLDKALMTIDDSGGYRFPIVDMLHQLYVNAIEKQKLDLPDLVSFLLEQLDQDNDSSPSIPVAYEDLLGEQGMQLFFDELYKRWQALPAPASDEQWSLDNPYNHQLFLLKNYAKQTKNHALLIELQQRSSRSTRDLLNLTEMLIDNEQWQRASETFERAKSSKETHYFRAQLLNCELKLLAHNKAFETAFSLINQAFDKQPTFALYKQCFEFAKEHGIRFDPQSEIDHLTEQMHNDPLNQFTFSRLILEIHFYHEHYSQILDIEAQDKLPKEFLERLIHAHPNAPEITLPLYEKLVDSLVRFADNEHYRQAVLALICAQKEALKPACQWEFEALITRLRARHKAKRNFIKLLNENFGE